MKKYLEIGEVVSVHGLRGDIKLYPWSDSAAALAKLKRLFFDDKGERLYKPEKISIQKNMLLVKLQGVDSVEAARSYIGKTVFAAREDGIQEVVLAGNLATLKEGLFVFKDIESLHNIKFIVPEHAEYTTAIGAVMSAI